MGLFAVLCKITVLCVKVACFIFLMMWVRWTLPRFRFDQLMRLAWKGLIPITLGLFALTAMLLYFGRERSAWAFVGNVAIAVTCLVMAAYSRTEVTGPGSP